MLRLVRSCVMKHIEPNRGGTASLRTKILDFRGFDSNIIFIVRCGISRLGGKLSGNVESTNLSRDNLGREIGRTRFEPPKQRRVRSASCELGRLSKTKERGTAVFASRDPASLRV